MSATITLDKFEILWYLHGGMCGSHLRWDVYERVANLYSQLSDDEREFIYMIAKRDLNQWEGKNPEELIHDTPYKHFMHLLARYNPANRYVVKLKEGRKKAQTVEAYKWDDDYYVNWQWRIDKNSIKDVKQIPYGKCQNIYCELREQCMRFNTYNEGDKIHDSLTSLHVCEKCDFNIKEVENKPVFKEENQ